MSAREVRTSGPKWCPRTSVGRGGKVCTTPARGCLCSCSCGGAVAGRRSVRRGRGFARPGPPASRRVLDLVASGDRQVGAARQWARATTPRRVLVTGGVTGAERRCRAGRGARPPATRCSYAARHTEHGLFCCRQRPEHSGQLPFASGSCAASSARQPSVSRGSSERATDRRDGASASLASSVSRSNRSHTALRRTCPRISSTETSPSPFRLLGGLT